MVMKKFALCLSNDFGDGFSGDDALPGLVYETTGVEKGMVRIVDEDCCLSLLAGYRRQAFPPSARNASRPAVDQNGQLAGRGGLLNIA